MKEKLLRFMYGRYGVDKLSKHLVTIGMILYILSILFGKILFSIPTLLLFIYGYYRMFSKNTTKRYRELCAYERFLAKVKSYPSGWKRKLEQWKKYHIFNCPGCKQKIRVPRGRGMIEIRCQKCNTTFRKRS
ncbi:MAG TPA: hypothetical protein VJY54_02660 [Lachnospiraceae bacterium]|nr:hypothetical protein [Lachnospiraceae bacterium]